MQAKEIIFRKRGGEENTRQELEFLLNGFLRGEVKEYQMSAWLMAVYFRGMTARELSTWTELMWRSGVTFPKEPSSSSHQKQYWIDKHSTGGVGDKTSLILVPLVKTVCHKYFPELSIRIPMVSGRGLGHTGGTLDKLESVNGFQTRIDLTGAMKLLESQGFVMMGQTKDIAPADELIYALRDVTSTIESIPLIVSSILSKKLSENLDGILFDVKTGLGAFMSDSESAKLLAIHLRQVALDHGVDAVALISQMDEPLGRKAGNFMEVEECADFLKGLPREADLQDLVWTSASWMLHLASGRKLSLNDAQDKCRLVTENGMAYDLFRHMFESQGGRFDEFERERSQFKKNYLEFDFKATQSGVVREMHARKLGVLLVEMGGGRVVKEAQIDHKVGFEFFKKVGDRVQPGDVMVRVIYRQVSELVKIETSLNEAVKIELGHQKSLKTPIVREILS
jgi:pyrimidine-nucleoside phosphorylase